MVLGETCDGDVFEYEERLEGRFVVAACLYDLSESEVGVFFCFGLEEPHLWEPLGEIGLGGHFEAQGDGLDGDAHHVIGAAEMGGSARYGDAAGEVVYTEVAGEGEEPCGLEQGALGEATVFGGLGDGA